MILVKTPSSRHWLCVVLNDDLSRMRYLQLLTAQKSATECLEGSSHLMIDECEFGRVREFVMHMIEKSLDK